MITFSSIIILTIICIKYKPVYEVTLSGKALGFISEKESIENRIDSYINESSNSIAFREINEMPEYELKLINRNEETKEKEIMMAVKDMVITTYRRYAITLDGEQKLFVESQNEAEKVITEIKTGLDEKVDLNLGIIENFTTEYSISNEEEAKNVLNEVKVAKVKRFEQEEADKKAKMKIATAGKIAGIPISVPVLGSVSSRFGSRDAKRSSAHTGLDIATKTGTDIKPIASGTVTLSQYNGSYGKLIIIDHGNGIESYYAHCDALYVGVGETVDTNKVISTVGSTGNSTGSHLHLEIRVNGRAVNPQNYLY